MKKAIKWIGIILGALLLVAAISSFYLKSKFVKQGTRKVDAKVTAIVIPSDSASLERGKLLAVGCRECHGHDYSGKDFFNDPAIGYMACLLYTSNIRMVLKKSYLLTRPGKQLNQL